MDFSTNFKQKSPSSLKPTNPPFHHLLVPKRDDIVLLLRLILESRSPFSRIEKMDIIMVEIERAKNPPLPNIPHPSPKISLGNLAKKEFFFPLDQAVIGNLRLPFPQHTSFPTHASYSLGKSPVGDFPAKIQSGSPGVQVEISRIQGASRFATHPSPTTPHTLRNC
jgi:hypothetical protein